LLCPNGFWKENLPIPIGSATIMHPVPVTLLGFTALGEENNMAVYTTIIPKRVSAVYIQ